jgi:hypothetical protein
MRYMEFINRHGVKTAVILTIGIAIEVAIILIFL